MAKGYYHRSFVILQPGDGRFNISSGKTAAGHCKMEVINDKCKMSFHVQDLKPRQTDKGGYDIFLVSAHNNIPCLKIANIVIDERGRGECILELDINHVAGFNYSLDQFHGLALVCNDPEDIKLPLVGYANKRVTLDWAGRIKRELERHYGKEIKSRIRQDRITETTSKSLLDGKEASLHAKEAELTEPGKKQTLKGTHGGKMADVEEKPVKNDKQEAQDVEPGIRQGAKQPEQEQREEIPKDDVQRWKKEKVEEKLQQEESSEKVQQRLPGERGQKLQQKEEEQQDKQYKAGYSHEMTGKEPHYEKSEINKPYTYWDRVEEYYDKMFKYNKKVDPFDTADDNVEWVEVPLTGGYNIHGYISSPYYYSDDFGYPYRDHYIVGIMKEKDEVCYIIYGVPGRYTDMPPIYMQGYSTWMPVKKGYGMGYWLLYIDARTGGISYSY